jgi:hypothetical protein
MEEKMSKIKSEKLSLEDFIKKAKKVNSGKETVEIETENYGPVTFVRPNTNSILKYIDGCSNAITTDKNGNVESQDMFGILEAAKEFVFNCCPTIKSQQLRDELDIADPLETPVKVFGINGTIELAGKILDEFNGNKVAKEVAEEIKNS